MHQENSRSVGIDPPTAATDPVTEIQRMGFARDLGSKARKNGAERKAIRRCPPAVTDYDHVYPASRTLPTKSAGNYRAFVVGRDDGRDDGYYLPGASALV